MAIINKIENIASITFEGNKINSLPVETLLLLAPTIVKTVDKPLASLEDTLTYTILITNLSLTAITTLPFEDIIPGGSTYVAGSFEVNDATATPTLTDNVLTYTIPTIGILGTAKIQFQVTVVGGTF